MQTSTLRYKELEYTQVDRLLKEQGFVQVALAGNHAAVLSSLIETAQAVKDWRRMPRMKRIAPLAKSLLLVARILIRHTKLFELLNMIVVQAVPHSSQRLADGSVLFRFGRAHGKV